jgi:hypothetical protein
MNTVNTGHFTSDNNEPGGIENATHNTLERRLGHGGDKYPAFPPDVLWVAFSIKIFKTNTKQGGLIVF